MVHSGYELAFLLKMVFKLLIFVCIYFEFTHAGKRLTATYLK